MWHECLRFHLCSTLSRHPKFSGFSVLVLFIFPFCSSPPVLTLIFYAKFPFSAQRQIFVILWRLRRNGIRRLIGVHHILSLYVDTPKLSAAFLITLDYIQSLKYAALRNRNGRSLIISVERMDVHFLVNDAYKVLLAFGKPRWASTCCNTLWIQHLTT